jgi:hypothetical protein
MAVRAPSRHRLPHIDIDRGRSADRAAVAGCPVSLENRIIEARRVRCLERLIRMGQSRPNAEQWCDAWEREAEKRGWPRSREFWDHGQLWIDAQIQKTPKPTEVLVSR